MARLDQMEDFELRDKMKELAFGFPFLRGQQAISDWNTAELDALAASDAAGSGEIHAIKFLLAVWDSSKIWQSGKFDVIEALSVWDVKSRDNFVKWANDPWWA